MSDVQQQLLVRLRTPAWCYDESGQQFSYIDPEDGKQAAAEIERLREARDIDRRCALYWWRVYRKEHGQAYVTVSSDGEEDAACNAAVAEMDAKDKALAALMACRRGDQRCHECPDTECCDNWNKAAREEGGGA